MSQRFVLGQLLRPDSAMIPFPRQQALDSVSRGYSSKFGLSSNQHRGDQRDINLDLWPGAAAQDSRSATNLAYMLLIEYSSHGHHVHWASC